MTTQCPEIRRFVLDEFTLAAYGTRSGGSAMEWLDAAEVTAHFEDALATEGEAFVLDVAERSVARILSTPPLGPLLEGFFAILGRSARSMMRCTPAFYSTALRGCGEVRFDESCSGGALVFTNSSVITSLPSMRIVLRGYLTGGLRHLGVPGDVLEHGDFDLLVAWHESQRAPAQSSRA